MITAAPIKINSRRRHKPKLTVLSFGGGQDSTAILYALIFDAKIRKRYAPNDFIVVFSDTGDEHPMTYLHLLRVEKFCGEHSVPFFHLTPDMGFHTEAWRSLRHQYTRSRTVGSKGFRKTCTVNLKILPIYRFLNDWVGEQYGYHKYGTVYRKHHALVSFAQEHKPIHMLIGIARSEEARIDSTFCEDCEYRWVNNELFNACPKCKSDNLKGGKATTPGRWFDLSIYRVYPLTEIGWNRQDCQNFISGLGMTVPWPSNCMLCPYMSKLELLWLFKHHPEDFQDWVEFEKNKFIKFSDKGDKNIGVFGDRRSLTDILAEAQEDYADWTDERIAEYKFSHGHCVMSKY